MRRIIDFRFLLTPIAKTVFIVNGVKRKMYYIFGFKVADLAYD